MLKSLRAGLKGLFPSADRRPNAAPAAGARRAPSAWFVEARKRVAAPDATLPDEVHAILEREPPNAEAHVIQGELMLAARAAAAAVPVLQRAISLSPDFAEAHNALGLAFHRLGRTQEATACFQRALELAHDLVSAHVNLGQLYEGLGRIEDAADCYNLALAFDASADEAELGIGRIMKSAGRVDESIAQIRRVIARKPGYAPAFFELARALNDAGDTKGAIAAYEQAIVLQPGYAEPQVNLGLMYLSQLGDAPGAEDLFRQAAQANPDLIEAQANLGLALQEQGRFEEAQRHYDEQIRRWPDVIEFRWNRGLAYLAAGNFADGWEDFELRKLRPDAGGVHQKFLLPDWDGSRFDDRWILVYGEQGIGDEIMFASCLPEVISQAGVCVVECDARLAPIYRRSFPRARIEARGQQRSRNWQASYPALALQSAVGSLPRYLRRRRTDFPGRKSYLVADAGARAEWRARLEQRGRRPVIGISWRGGTRRTRGELRSLELGELDSLFEVAPGALFVVLQRDLREGERAALERRPGVFIPDSQPDIDGLAALLSALDLVISADNTNVHLAGALGCPLWVMLPYCSEWRYLWEGESMPWYPSARLLRQPRPGDWRAVVGAVRERLRNEPG